jgi:hypothetical protein
VDRDEIEMVEDWRGRMIPADEWNRRRAWRKKLKRCLESEGAAHVALVIVAFACAWISSALS